MRAVLWWGADDHSMSPKIPIHGGATALDSSYDDANCTSRSVCRRENGLPGTVTELSWDAAWWLNNLVADIVYTRFDRAAPVVRGAKQALDGQLERRSRPPSRRRGPRSMRATRPTRRGPDRAPSPRRRRRRRGSSCGSR